jgi:two-component sensor histidine kinase
MADSHGAHAGLGVELVRSLAEQLRGTCRFGGPPGVEAILTFPARWPDHPADR